MCLHIPLKVSKDEIPSNRVLVWKGNFDSLKKNKLKKYITLIWQHANLRHITECSHL